MSERHERDVLFPWEVERARKSAEAEAERDSTPDQSGRSEDAAAESKAAADEPDADPVPDGPPDGEDTGQDRGEPVQDGAADQVESGGVGAEAALTTGDDARTDPDSAARAEGTADPGSVDANAQAADTPSEAEHEEDEERFAVLDTEFARRAAERASAALRDKPIAQKEYYSISEVCELVGLKPHVLRYWETQFHVLNPSKNRSGNRVYQRKEIRLITLVKHLLYEEKYTVEGAKAKLDQLRRGRELADATGVVLDRSMVEQLRADLSELATLLTPPSHE